MDKDKKAGKSKEREMELSRRETLIFTIKEGGGKIPPPLKLLQKGPALDYGVIAPKEVTEYVCAFVTLYTLVIAKVLTVPALTVKFTPVD